MAWVKWLEVGDSFSFCGGHDASEFGDVLGVEEDANDA